ncbi:MAG: sensor histidine kinase, partial [Myxococcaceae bacterium]
MLESCFNDSAVSSLLAPVLEKLPKGFVICGESFGACCNEEAARLLGLPERRLSFGAWKDQVRFRSEEGSALSLFSLLERALDGSEVRRRRAEIIQRSGTRVQISVDAIPLPAEGACVLLLEDLAWEVEERQSRDRWIAALGHEMRGALHSLATGTAIALHRDVSQEVRRHLDAIAQNTLLLARLVGDLTTSALMMDGALEVKPIAIDLRSFIEGAARTAELPGAAHDLIFSIPEKTVAFVDPDRLQQIVTNLLGNAAKYSSPGALFLEAELREA